MGKYYFYLHDGCNSSWQMNSTLCPKTSVRQANTCHLWISCTTLMLFSAPIFWGFFEFFYHKKVSQYYIINLRKSFSLSFLLSFLGIFLFFLFYSHNYENRAKVSELVCCLDVFYMEVSSSST